MNDRINFLILNTFLNFIICDNIEMVIWCKCMHKQILSPMMPHHTHRTDI